MNIPLGWCLHLRFTQIFLNRVNKANRVLPPLPKTCDNRPGEYLCHQLGSGSGREIASLSRRSGSSRRSPTEADVPWTVDRGPWKPAYNGNNSNNHFFDFYNRSNGSISSKGSNDFKSFFPPNWLPTFFMLRPLSNPLTLQLLNFNYPILLGSDAKWATCVAGNFHSPYSLSYGYLLRLFLTGLYT